MSTPTWAMRAMQLNADPSAIMGGISSLGSLAGTYLSNQNTANANSQAGSLASNSVLNPFSLSNNGFGINYYGGGKAAINSPVNSSGLASLANSGIGSAGSFMNGGLPANITGAYGTYGSNFGTANTGLNALMGSSLGGNAAALGVLGAGGSQLNNPLVGQADSAASNLLGTAGSDFNSVYNTQYNSLLQQLQLPQQFAMNNNAASQFGRGTFGMGSMGVNGATGPTNLQTMSLGQGFGQADLAAAQQAYSMALQSQNAATQNAGILGTMGSNQQLTGAQLLNSGFGGLSSTGYLGNYLGSNLNALGTSNLNLQGQYATMPSALAGQTLSNLTLPSLSGLNTNNAMGLANYQAGLSTGQYGAQDANNAARTIYSNPLLGSTGGANALGSLGTLLNGLGGSGSASGLNGLLGQIPGLSGFANSLLNGGSNGFASPSVSSLGDLGAGAAADVNGLFPLSSDLGNISLGGDSSGVDTGNYATDEANAFGF